MTLSRIGLPVEAAILSHTSPTSQRAHRLPSEILAAIFVYCAHDYYSQDLGETTEAVPCWVNVSYVCQSWRNAALSCSTLWSYIFFFSLRWTEELLVRSRRAPLKVHLKPTDTSYDEWCLAALKKILAHVERIQELRLQIPESPEWIEEIFDSISLRAPLLQELEFSTEGGLTDVFIDIVPFNGDTPSLRSLSLANCGLPWCSLKLSRLTMLHLECLPTEDIDMEDVLIALGCMERLSHLYLTDSLPQSRISSGDDSNALPKIKLPCLSRLRIEDSVAPIIGVLSRIDIPANTELRLDCTLDGFNAINDCIQLSSVLARRFHTSADSALPSPTIRSLVIEPSRVTPRLTFSALEQDHESHISRHTLRYTAWERHIPLQIYFVRAGIASNMIRAFCRAMPLDNVQSLHVVGPPSSLYFWEFVLHYLRALRYLRLSEGKMPSLASLLFLPPHDSTGTPDPVKDRDDDEDPHMIYAPQLEKLELDRISFAPERPVHSTASIVGTLSSLKDALSTRHGPSVRLGMLNCDECPESPD